MPHNAVLYRRRMPALKATSEGVEIAIWVVPGASRTALQGMHGERLKVSVAAPAEGGRANRAVSDLLESLLGEKVTLKRGMRSRAKVFLVAKTDIEGVRRKLGG